MRDVVIVSAARTAIGGFQGMLSGISATELGALAIVEAIHRAGISKEDVDEVIMGNVLPCGLGQNPARQALLKGDLPQTVEALTVNKVCGSGLKSVMLGAQAIMVNDADVVVAGGMENMNLAPYFFGKGQDGLSYGSRADHRWHGPRWALVSHP